MANAIEQTKREMYNLLQGLKDRQIGPAGISAANDLESSLEAHLEELRQDSMDTLGRLAAMTEDREELARRNRAGYEALGAVKQERDSIQLRLHAVDHAYSESQKNIGLQLNLIGSLRKELRESYRFDSEETGTCGQICKDRGASAKLGGKTEDVLAEALKECQSIVTEWAMNGLRAKKAIRAVSAIVNGRSEVLQALIDHGEASECQHVFTSYGRCKLCLELHQMPVGLTV